MDKKAFQNIQKKLGLTNEGISKALDVELFTVQMWACNNWPIPCPIAKFLRTLLTIKRNNEAIYRAGYDKGRSSGYKEGHRGHCKVPLTQYTKGYDEGYKEGVAVGLRRGRAEGNAEGNAAEYARGLAEGYSAGHSDGHSAGIKTDYNDGRKVGLEASHAEEQKIISKYWQVITALGMK